MEHPKEQGLVSLAISQGQDSAAAATEERVPCSREWDPAFEA
jgi:hypothetical protein